MHIHTFFKVGQDLLAEALQPGLRDKFFKATATEKDLQREGTLAVDCYADWLAEKIWRHTRFGRNPCETIPLPECSPADRTLIAQKYNGRRDVLDAVIAAVSANPTYLPPVGIIKNGVVHIDHPNLSAWGTDLLPDLITPKKASPRIKS